MTTEVKWRGAKALEGHLVLVDQLVGFPGNVIDETHVLSIANSLDQFGQVRAVLTWENAEEFGLPPNTIVGGHHVWKGSQTDRLKWTHVAAIPAHFESREKAEKYLALDNLLVGRSAERMSAQMSILEAQGATDEVSESDWAELEALRDHAIAMVPVADLKVHERSTREDPLDIVESIARKLQDKEFFGDVVIARDGTILVGEEVMRAAALAGVDKVPARRVDVDPDSPAALKIMAEHYATGKRVMVDDRAFAEMLRELREELGTLEGTGYDEEALGALLLMTRSAAEIKDANQAMEWVGLPEYEKQRLPAKLTISFETEEERDLFMLEHGLETRHRHLRNVSLWWPPRERDDPGSLRFVGEKPEERAGPMTSDELRAVAEAEGAPDLDGQVTIDEALEDSDVVAS